MACPSLPVVLSWGHVGWAPDLRRDLLHRRVVRHPSLTPGSEQVWQVWVGWAVEAWAPRAVLLTACACKHTCTCSHTCTHPCLHTCPLHVLPVHWRPGCGSPGAHFVQVVLASANRGVVPSRGTWSPRTEAAGNHLIRLLDLGVSVIPGALCLVSALKLVRPGTCVGAQGFHKPLEFRDSMRRLYLLRQGVERSSWV